MTKILKDFLIVQLELPLVRNFPNWLYCRAIFIRNGGKSTHVSIAMDDFCRTNRSPDVTTNGVEIKAVVRCMYRVKPRSYKEDRTRWIWKSFSHVAERAGDKFVCSPLISLSLHFNICSGALINLPSRSTNRRQLLLRRNFQQSLAFSFQLPALAGI